MEGGSTFNKLKLSPWIIMARTLSTVDRMARIYGYNQYGGARIIYKKPKCI